MNKNLKLNLILLILFISCKTLPEKQFVDIEQFQNITDIDYNFWGFNNDGSNRFKEKESLITRNIEYNNSNLVSDGIYEYSGRFTSENVVVSDGFNNVNSRSIAVKFKIDFKSLNKKDYYVPILIKGKSYRCFKIMVIDDVVKLSFNGNFSFTIPNKDLILEKVIIKPEEFNEVFVSYDLDKHLVYMALNDGKPQIIEIPKDFIWQKCYDRWTIQDFSNGKAFPGFIDYIFISNTYLNRKTMRKLIHEK